MKRRVCEWVSGLVLGAVWFAGSAIAELASEVAELDASLAARVAAIGSPAPSAKAAKEAKLLVKARDALAEFTGALDLADVDALKRAGAQVHRSKTADAAALDATAQVFAEMLTLTESQIAAAEALRLKVTDARQQKTVAKLLEKAGALRVQAAATVASNRKKAYGLAVGALSQSVNGLAKAKEYAPDDGGGGGGGGGGGPTGLSLPMTRLFVTFAKPDGGTVAQDVLIGGDLRLHAAYDGTTLLENDPQGKSYGIRVLSRSKGPAAGANEHAVYLSTSTFDPPRSYIGVKASQSGGDFKLSTFNVIQATGELEASNEPYVSWFLEPRPDKGDKAYSFRFDAPLFDDPEEGSYYLSNVAGSASDGYVLKARSSTEQQWYWNLFPLPSQSGM